jgi:hypothetical protein
MTLEEKINEIYKEYIKEVYNMKDISRWTKKITITEKVLNPERTNEQKILDALEDEEDIQAGNKVFMYFDENNALKLEKHWKGDHHRGKMVAKLWNTLKIFNNVINIKNYGKYHLKNKKIQEELQNILNSKS